MNTTNPWYVAVDDTTVGPAETELVIRGIEQRKIPPEALVCPVGSAAWTPLATVADFHAAVVRSYPPPPPDSEEARSWIEQGFHFPSLGALPQFGRDAGDDEWDSETTPLPRSYLARTAAPSMPVVEAEEDLELAPDVEPEPLELARASMPVVETEAEEELAPEVDELPALELARASMPVVEAEEVLEPERDMASAVDIDVDVDVDLSLGIGAPPGIDWTERFQSYFLVGDAVELPEQRALLESLSAVSPETFRHDEALWNLALCLAFGSDVVGEAAARTFFSAVAEQGSAERLEWMSRTLLGQGFVPSGIPSEAGLRGCRRLRSSCPPALTRELPRELLQ